MKIFTAINPKWLAAIVALVLAGYLVISFATMPRPRGLRIYAPQATSNSVKSGNSSVNSLALARVNAEAFAASFALDYHKTFEKKVEKVAEKKPEPEKVVAEPVEKAPEAVDLYAAGYRLKGVILEKDGNSAAFVYDPDSKSTLVVRENSRGDIRILGATMRSVRLMTPKGEGELELEDAKGRKGGRSGFITPGASGQGIPSPQASAKAVKSERLLRQTKTSANDVAGMISAGHFQVRPSRGIYQVEVRKVPDSLAAYGLRPGDRIVGTANSDFRQSQDVALQLGGLSERPAPIKIQRGRRTMYLSPPANAAPQKTPDQEESPPK